MCPPRPFSFWTSQGHGSLFKWVMPFKFGGKLKTHEYYNWWKFGVDISNHFWEIQNLTFFHSNSFPLAYKNSFWKLFLYAKGKELEWKNDKIWISQKWFEISTPNFHQLFTSIGTHFVLNLKAFGALDLDFPPKTSKTSNGRGGPNFWATPFKFGENSFLS